MDRPLLTVVLELRLLLEVAIDLMGLEDKIGSIVRIVVALDRLELVLGLFIHCPIEA